MRRAPLTKGAAHLLVALLLVACPGTPDITNTGASCALESTEPSASSARSLATADGNWTGSTGDQATGSAVAAHDVDGDGVLDLVLGAPGASGGAGALVVVTGPAWCPGSTSDATIILAGSAGAGAGSVLESEKNGGALLVGAPTDSSGAEEGGAVYLVRGPIDAPATLSEAASAWFLGDEHHAHVGAALAPVDDQDGDGIPEVLVGAPSEEYAQDDGAGTVYLFPGGASDALGPADALATVRGAQPLQGVGAAVGGGGDANGDSIDDVLLNGPWYFEGPLDGAITVAEADGGTPPGDSSDWPLNGDVAFVGDVDGDGLDDAAIGAVGTFPYVGFTYLFSGPDLAELAEPDSATARFGGGSHDCSEAGAALSALGDLDGDGRAELLVGAPGSGGYCSDYYDSYAGEGIAWVIFGGAEGELTLESTGASDVGRLLRGEVGDEAWELGSDRAGAAVASAGDMDGDGLPEVLVGAPGVDVADAEDGGAAYLLFARSLGF